MKFNPAPDYPTLLTQARAMHMLINSLESQLSDFRKNSDPERIKYLENELDAQRDLVHLLTNDLEKAAPWISEEYKNRNELLELWPMLRPAQQKMFNRMYFPDTPDMKPEVMMKRLPSAKVSIALTQIQNTIVKNVRDV